MTEAGIVLAALLVAKSALEIVMYLVKKKNVSGTVPVMSTDCYYPTDRTRDSKIHANTVRIGNHLKVPDIEV